jgi:hypothetical protein
VTFAIFCAESMVSFPTFCRYSEYSFLRNRIQRRGCDDYGSRLIAGGWCWMSRDG